MTKSEYISRLSQALASVPQAECQNFIAYYEGLFNSGLAAGKSEEEIVNSWGSPEAAAAGYMSGRAASYGGASQNTSAGGAGYSNASAQSSAWNNGQQTSAQAQSQQSAEAMNSNGNVVANYEYSGNPAFIYLNMEAAKLNISTSPSVDKIYYRLSYKLKSNPEKAPQLELTEQGGGIYITLKYKSMMLSFMRVSDITVDVVFPQTYAGGLYIKCDASKIAAACSGNLKVISADVDAGKTEIDCNGFSGALQLKSNASKVQIYNISGSVECNINAGKASFNYKQFAAAANISSKASSVDIALPADTGARLNYSGELGSFKNAFPITPYGDIGSGGPAIIVKNSASKITISKI